MDDYRRLLKLKKLNINPDELNETKNFAENTNKMSDWGDEEITTAGRSFDGGKKNASNDDNWGDNNGNNDDGWGTEEASNTNGDGGFRNNRGGGRGRGGGGRGGGGQRNFGGRTNGDGGGEGGFRDRRRNNGQQGDGDWKCNGCDSSNYARRTECFRCKAPKGDSGDTAEEGFGDRGGKNGQHQQRDGDWKCSSCDSSNFARRTECFRCKASKGDSGDNAENGFGDRSEKKEQQQRDGDWKCSGCDSSNYSRRTECFRCKAPKAAGGNDGEENGEPQKPREFYIPPEPTEVEEEMFGSGISSGINFSKYDNIPVKITGRNVPETITSFEEAGLRDLVMENIKKSGYKKATPIQKASIPVVMAGRDLMACAQTGSGKTAAYLLPIINALLNESADMSIGRPQALVVAPTRELAIQIFNEARKFAHGSYLRISIVYGGTSSKHQSETVSKGCHILIATPGRLLDFVDRAYITFEEMRFVVLDEADRMLDMGFKDSIDRIMSHSTMREQEKRQNLMFSATFPEDIQQLASNYLRDYVFVAIGIVGGACSDVQQVIMEVPKFDKRGKLMELLQESSEGTIVFVETKRGADFLASLLSETEYPTTSIHGDRLQRQREEALRDLKSGKMKVLVATSVAARGLDIRNIKHVVNYDMPDSLDEYVHRIGRTGRVGNNGRSTSFFDPEKDSPLAAGLIKILEGSGQDVPSFLRNYATGGGGGDYKSSNFGGRDMRQSKGFSDQPQALEAEEDWG